MIFTSTGGCNPYSLASSYTISVFNLQNFKYSAVFSGTGIDLQQFETNTA